MKKLNHLLVLLIIAIACYILISSDQPDLSYQILSMFVLCLFGFNLYVRKIAWFKPYFTSRYNILTSKFRSNKEFEFSKIILFHKFIEVLTNSNFNVIQANESKGEIFVTNSISWTSWGENIYIDFEERNGKTVMTFCSSCFFQIYSWGKNEQNYNKLLGAFENSLVI